MFHQTPAIPCLASMSPGNLYAGYLGDSEQLRACWLPCASGETVLLLRGSLARSQEGLGPDASCFSFSSFCITRPKYLFTEAGTHQSPPKRLYPAHQGTAHVWILGGLGRPILSQQRFRLASALVYESPALLRISAGKTWKTGK